MSSFHAASEWEIQNKSKSTIFAAHANVADSFFSRLCGLIPKTELLNGEGLIITRSKSIHMVFMRFSIDAVFIDKKDVIVGLVENIGPYHFSKTFWKASCVIELPPKTIFNTNSEVGDSVEFFEQKSF